MKKIVLFAALFIGVTAFGQAESKKISQKETSAVASDRGNTGVEELIKELDLTSDQTIKVKELLQKRKDELANLKLEKSDAKSDAKVDALNKKYEKEFKAILTPEQIKKLDAKKQDVKLEKKSQNLKSTKVKALKSN